MKVYFFGDSICVGQHVDMSRTWVCLVSHILKHNFGSKVDVSNRSINGDTTLQALMRLQFDVLSHSPDIVYVQFGLNDCNVWDNAAGLERVLPNTFEANLKDIICRLNNNSGVRHIIIGTNHPTLKHKVLPGHRKRGLIYEQNNDIYNDIIRSVCSQHKEVTLFDINRVMVDNVSSDDVDKYLLPDKLHLSSLGHEFYFQEFKGVIFDIVGKYISSENLEVSELI